MTTVAQPERVLPQCPSFTLTRTGLRVQGVPTYAEWEQAGQQLFGLGNATAWAVGDWLLYGEGRGDWGETYSQAIDLTKRSYGSLVQCARVSRAFTCDARFANVSWSHHQAVVSLPPEARHVLLERAAAEQWTRDDLRACVRDQQPGSRPQRMSECPKCGHRWAVS